VCNKSFIKILPKNTKEDIMTTPILISDSCADLHYTIFEQRDILKFKFPYLLNNDIYYDNNDHKETDKIYHRMINGERGKTSLFNAQEMKDIFLSLLPLNRPIIHFCFSSALSGTYASARLIAAEIMRDNPGSDITVIDSKAASSGEGLILLEADNMRKAGKSKDEIVNWIEENKMRMNHFFTVADLSYLKEGGRLSAAAAFIGDILNIQPVLVIDAKGGISSFRNERGRKKVFKNILAQMEARAEDLENQTIALSHTYCEDDTLEFKELILNRFKVKNIIMERIGPVIGMHVGPSTIALFFWGKERKGELI
jgi:DegV family protein with EDD domain